MTAHAIAVNVLLGITAIACWLGALGMARMRDPFQALHYMSFPAILGMGALTIAMFIQTGWSQASWKSTIIFGVLMASNSVGTHAAARAFRQRQKGHWQPKPEDAEVTFLGGKPQA